MEKALVEKNLISGKFEEKEKKRRFFFGGGVVVFFFNFLKSIHSMRECLKHTWKYLVEQFGAALKQGLVGVCRPVVITSIRQ